MLAFACIYTVHLARVLVYLIFLLLRSTYIISLIPVLYFYTLDLRWVATTLALSPSLIHNSNYDIRSIHSTFSASTRSTYITILLILLISHTRAMVVVRARVRKHRQAQKQARHAKSNRKNWYVIKVMNSKQGGGTGLLVRENQRLFQAFSLGTVGRS